MDSTYLQIAARLENVMQTNYNTIFDGQVIKPAQWIDLYNGQPDDIKDGLHQQLPFALPALFIELPDVDWTSLNGGGRTQRGELTVRIHVAQETYEESYQGSPNQTDSAKSLAFLKQVSRALHLYRLSNSDMPLRRTATSLDYARNALSIHIITFSCTIEDNLEPIVNVPAPVNLDSIEVTYNPEL